LEVGEVVFFVLLVQPIDIGISMIATAAMTRSFFTVEPSFQENMVSKTVDPNRTVIRDYSQKPSKLSILWMRGTASYS
jgi:hypothetical protein